MSEVYEWRDAPPAAFCVIGDPVAHSMSPRMHAAAFRSLGLPYRYVAVHVPRGEVSQALDRLAALGYRGANVTVPHKEAALQWSSAREPMAVRVRAANTIRFLDRSCVNTDVPGFLDTLRNLDLPNRRVLVLGAGGTARAVLAALSTVGCEVALWNRTRANATSLLELVGVEAEIVDHPAYEGAALVVNTTSASLQGESIDVAWKSLAESAVAYDMMYAMEPTPFLHAAASEGFRTVDGRAMLVAQGAHSLAYWLDVEAPREAMLEAIS